MQKKGFGQGSQTGGNVRDRIAEKEKVINAEQQKIAEAQKTGKTMR